MATSKQSGGATAQLDKRTLAAAMADNAPVNMMIADKRFNLVHLNPQSVKTLKTLEHLLPAPVDELVGQSIDIFHKDPSYQRGILSNPANLPIDAQIRLGPETLDLNVTAVYDDKDQFIGSMAAWSVATEKVRLAAEAYRVQGLVDNAPINLMLATKDGEITFMNPSSDKTLRTVEQHLPVKVDDIIGGSMDVFHPDPSHQRRIIGDPRNLPYEAIIKVGPELLELQVSAVTDANGEYQGPMVAWSVATERVRAEIEGKRVSSIVENAPINLMLATKEGDITFMNPASDKTLRSVQEHLPVKVDDIVGGSMDVFHKDPSHQRRVIGDAANLPFEGVIDVGPEKLELQVSAIMDADGEYQGPMVAWSVVTERERLSTEATRTGNLVANAPINLMLATKEGLINYMNPASTATLKTVEQHLPVRVDEILNNSMDVFHKDPSHQRRIIGDARNLPFEGVIDVGPEKLELQVSPIMGKDGEYQGPMVAWSVVTERVKLAEEAARIQGIIQNAPINIILSDPEGNVTFMNPASERTLRGLESATGVRADEVVGGSIDRFHSNPSHQRRIIADASNMPIETEINVADQILALNVAAIYNATGTYIGPMVAWEVVTEARRMESEAKERVVADQNAAEELKDKVEDVLRVVSAAASGDLTAATDVAGSDPVGQLGEGVMRMTTELKDIIIQIQEGSDQFSSSASAISDGSNSLAEGSQTQAATVEEMTASVGELTNSIDLIAKNARDANEVADETSKMAEEGGDAVDRSITAMKEINKSSEQISEIIQVISEIASQTNLLALNAAIEAARAGEHGLGFAVVADEVRKLAERSSEAAKQITGLIKESTQRVTDGAKLSEQTGDALKKIIDGVTKSARGIAQIASATDEQSATAQEVGKGIQNVASITENNSAASEEMASSSEELAAQAGAMKELVKRFKH